MMDLKHFVQSVLTEIISGIQAAQKETGGAINPEGLRRTSSTSIREVYFNNEDHGDFVDFDVALTVTSEGATGGKVAVWGMVSAGAESAQSSVTATRVKFSVPVILPRAPRS